MTTPSAYVTSTPNGSLAGNIVSSDVSSFSGTEAPSSSSNTLVGSTASMTKWQNVSELVRNMSLSESESSDTETDQLLPHNKDQQAFMPIDNKRCYYRVIAHEENVEDVAIYWQNLYQRDEQTAMIFIVQFFLDVATYQTFDASQSYNINLNQIRKQLEMEENCPDVIHNYNYLFATKSNWSLKAQTAIFEFVYKLVKMCYLHSLIANNGIFHEMFCFINLMASSEVMALRHTGVILTLKFAVACTEILQDAENEKKIEKIEIIKKSLKYLYQATLKNCTVHDPRLEDMRNFCAENMCNLMIVKPAIFLNEMAVFVLLEYIVDMRKSVRLSAVQTFKNLLSIDNLSKYLQGSITKVLRTISSKTILDIDYNVAVEAVNVLTRSIRIYRNNINQLTIDRVYKMVYNKHYPLGAAAGNFFITYIRSDQQNDNTVTVIRTIIKFSHMSGKEQLIPILVESLVDYVPELQEYETIIKILLKQGALNPGDQINLLEILSNTVVQVITGKAKYLRNDYRKGETNLDKNRMIMCKFIPALSSLIERAGDDRSLKNLLEIVLVFDYNDPILLKYQWNVRKMLGLLSAIFINSNCEDVLCMIVKGLVLNFDTLCPYRNNASNELQKITQYTINKFQEYIEYVSSDWSEHHVTSFETTLLKMSAIYEHYNMSFKWTFLLFSCLPKKIQKSNENILTYDLECGRHYLAWQLKNLLEADNEANIMKGAMERFSCKLQEYLNICFEYLQTSESHLFQTQAFKCICDLHTKIESELEGPVKINSKLEMLKIRVKEDANISCMINFLNKNVFQHSVPDSYGKKMLAKFLQAILDRMLPMDVFVKIFCHYYKFNTKYKDLFDQTLTQLRTIDMYVYLIVILSTLQSEFNNLPDVNDGESSESFDLKKLTVQFSLFVPYEHLWRILKLGINFAVKKERTLPFLSYMELFCNRLRADKRNTILNYLNEMLKLVKKEFADSKYVRNFVNRLNVKKNN